MNVIIIGASLAGSSTAITLLKSRPEAHVALIDRNLTRRASRCAGGISTYMLKKTGLTLPRTVIQDEIRGVEIYAGKASWRFTFPKPYGYVLNRALLEQHLINTAQRLGAHTLQYNVPNAETMDFILHTVESYCDYIVGADGLPSTVRAYLGIPNPKPIDVHIGLQYEADWVEAQPHTVQLYFSQEYAPEGYAWVFPAGLGKAKVGLGIPLTVKNPRLRLDKFITAINAPPVTSLIAKLIPTAPPMNTCTYGNTALVGDAALQCDPATGGGIANSVICGSLLGQALAVEDLSLYDKWWKREVGRRNRLRYRLKQLIHRAEVPRLLKALKGFSPKTPNVGFELTRALIHVLTHDPALLLNLKN